jgi:hypothetical protein
MESIVRNVADLEVAQRHWLETTLGQTLRDSQQVFIHVLTPGAMPDAAVKDRALADVQRLAGQAADFRHSHGISDAEAEAALDEALHNVRPDPTP